MSFKLTWKPPKKSIKNTRYEWSANHSWVVHEGGFNGRVRLYGRPWTWMAIKLYIDLLETFLEYFQQFEDFDLAFRSLSEDLSEAFTQAIEDPIYSYPTITYRQNGEVVSSPRNIVDTAELRDSQSYVIT